MPSTHWANIVTSVGAGFGAVAVVAGGWTALVYGRRASVSISAEAHPIPAGLVVISTRPKISAVGIRRVMFQDRGVKVRLTEIYVQDGELREGRYWEEDGAFEQQYVDAGEELVTTVVFPVMEPPGSVIGWQVFLRVSAITRLAKNLRSGWWYDQIFVSRPGGTKVI